MMPRWILPIVAALMLGGSVSAQAATIQISMENLVITPAEATAKVGDTIEWINKDIFAHTATARNGDWDVTIPPKKTVASILKKAGTAEYYCRLHPKMKATLGGGGPAWRDNALNFGVMGIGGRPTRFVLRPLRSVPSASFANAVVVLYA